MNRRERIEAGFMLSSYLDTLGFKNGSWEFNYNAKLDSIDKVNKIMMTMINEFLILGGPSDIDITGWNASDDTIMTIATAKGALTNDYKNMYIKVLPLLEESKRASGRVLLSSINCLKRNQKIKVDRNMGGNGAAMRTFPIGIKYNDEDKIIKESIMVSCLTHNYYIGFLGGVVSALFSSYALKGIKPWLWIEKLLKLYTTNTNTNMHLFDAKDTLQKFDKVTDIIDNYYDVRINLYQIRKNYMIQSLERELVLLNNKAKYIKENIEGTIDLRRKKKDQVIKMLQDKHYNIIDNDKDYTYLVKMPMDSVTEENVDKLNKEHENKLIELENVKKTTINQMWLNELDILHKQYIEYKEERTKLNNGEDLKKKKKVVVKKPLLLVEH